MSAAVVIDSLEFARAEQSISGSLRVKAMQRVEDLLFDAEGEVTYALQGGLDEQNKPHLALRITGQLHLQCQRCLGPLDYPVDVANTLLVLASDALADVNMDDPEEPDAIEASAELDVEALIEDELLLSLPLAPRHPEGACASRLGSQLDEHTAHGGAFAQLAALKRPHDKY